jgi:hypothetical protein
METGSNFVILRALGPTEPPIQGVPGALSLGIKRPMRGAVPPVPNTLSGRDAKLKRGANFTFKNNRKKGYIHIRRIYKFRMKIFPCVLYLNRRKN